MKYLLIIILFLSCNDQYHNENGNQKVTVDSFTIKAETAIQEIRDGNDTLNLCFHYFKKEMDAKQTRDDCEIKYLRTGKDKYRKLGNLYVDSVHYWYLQLKSVTPK